MQMLSRVVLLGAALLVQGQARLPRLPPTFQNSIVNLGKIDIILNLDKKNSLDSLPPLGSQHEMHTEPCPCGFKEISSDSSLLRRLLPANNFMPTSHQSCCDFHDEELVIPMGMDSGPNLMHNMPLFPFPLENIMPKSLPLNQGKKQLEIIFFPQKNSGIQTRKHKGDKVAKVTTDSYPNPPFPVKLEKEPAAEYPKLDNIKPVGGREPEYINFAQEESAKSVKRDLKESQPKGEVIIHPSDTNAL